MTLPLPLPPRCTDCDYCEPPTSADVVVVVCCYHAPTRTERQQRQYALDAEWIADRWDSMRDEQDLLISMGALRIFLRDRLFDALSEPLVTLSDDSPSDGPSGSEGDE